MARSITATEALQFLRVELDWRNTRRTWTPKSIWAPISQFGAKLDRSIELLNRALSMSGRYIRDQQKRYRPMARQTVLRAAGRYQEADQAYRWGHR